MMANFGGGCAEIVGCIPGTEIRAVEAHSSRRNMYFPEETEANAADPLLSRIEHRERVATMIATRDGATCHFDIYLQGPKETVFLDI